MQLDPDELLELEKVEDLAYSGLVEDQPKGKLSEKIFVQYFLPYFSGKTPITEEVINQWVSVAGGMTREVDIVDGKGEFLFTVPALYDTGTVTVRDDKISIFDVVSTANLHNERVPGSGDPYIAKASEETEKLVNKSKITQFWEEMSKRYNIIEKEKTSVESVEEDDLFDY